MPSGELSDVLKRLDAKEQERFAQLRARLHGLVIEAFVSVLPPAAWSELEVTIVDTNSRWLADVFERAGAVPAANGDGPSKTMSSIRLTEN